MAPKSSDWCPHEKREMWTQTHGEGQRPEGQKKDRSHGLELRAIKDGRNHQKLGVGPGTECPADGPEGTALPTSGFWTSGPTAVRGKSPLSKLPSVQTFGAAAHGTSTEGILGRETMIGTPSSWGTTQPTRKHWPDADASRKSWPCSQSVSQSFTHTLSIHWVPTLCTLAKGGASCEQN